MKDNFSAQAADYALFRPVYPKEMLQHIIAQVPTCSIAWDVGTGNGQVAVWLSKHFEQVYATDISENQLAQAPHQNNIQYQKLAAEEANFPTNSLDLVTVGQALHWFDLNRFYSIVKHCLKPNGIIAVFGYAFLSINPKVDSVITQLYKNVLEGYWDDERKHVEQEYESLSFPFQELPKTKFRYTTTWTLAHLLGYLNTWSAVQHYRLAVGSNPVDSLVNDLEKAWGGKTRQEVRFPMFLRLGKNIK